MMHQLNGSNLLLLSSKEKELPPIPSRASSTGTSDTAPTLGDSLLLPKSLNRKNIKKLSFTPTLNLPDDDETLGEYERFHNSQRQQSRNKLRPAPLLNLGNATNSQATVIDSLKSLDLEDSSLSGTATSNRRRQTVISSISPTKSVYTPLPRENKTRSALSSPLPVTPTASTSSTLNLKDADLVHLKDLGAGNLGVVLKVLHVPSQKTMARKVIHVDSKVAVQTQIIRELRIMHECQLPYIIEFYGAFARSNNTIVLCMEYGNCGSLDKIVQLCNPRQLPLLVIRKLLYLMLSGLTYLYTTHKIIHRDIKPLNVLMNHRGEFKLCDFGVLRELTNSLAMADTFVGTSTYMSPERIQGLTYGVKSDVWSMGLMLLELALGYSVWSDSHEDDPNLNDEDREKTKSAGPEGILDLLQRIVNEDSPTLTGRINRYTKKPYNAELCEFIDACLVKSDSARKSPQELLAFDLLKNVGLGSYDKEVKSWAKMIRKLHKERNEADSNSAE